ncbi:MAG: replication-relaxation family protein [Chloroflexota bacterium]|nr:replication-relaxation family protein [Chloroflexota bacterium]
MSRTASLFASLFDIRSAASHTDTTPDHARGLQAPKPDSLRYLPPPGLAGWSALPERDRRLLEWLVVGEFMTAELAAVLAYGSLRIAQRRLARLRQYRLVTGFWTANAQRPRGRYAYRLTTTCRTELEALLWGEVRPRRQPRGADRSIIHHLAVHDLLASFLRAARTDGGLIAWLPERICAALFDGYLRPDAIAAVRLANRTVLLFIERDTGSERLALLAAKARRYRAVLGPRPELQPAHVVFVTDSARRARSIVTASSMAAALGPSPRLWAAGAQTLERDPWSARWQSLDGDASRLADLSGLATTDDFPIVGPGCLMDPDQTGMLDERALDVLPWLNHFRGRSGL